MTKRKPRRSTWGSVRPNKGSTGDSWQLRYPVAGKPRTETVHGTEAEAYARLAARHVQYGDAETSHDLTLGDYWTQWYAPQLKEPEYRAGTIETYVNSWRIHIEPTFGARVIDRIRPAEVQAWLDAQSFGAAKHSREVLRIIVTRCHDIDMLCDRNVMSARYRLPKATEAAIAVNDAVWSPEEAETALQLARGQYWEPTFILSCFGGCRREEAAGAQVEDFERVETPDGLYLVYNVQRGVQYRGGKIDIGIKNPGARRVVIVPPPYADRLAELMPESGWLVSQCEDMPIDPNLMTVSFQRWLSRVPLAGIPWKNLRKTYATLAHARGLDIETVSKLCGHTNTATTSRYYDRPDARLLVDILRSHDGGNPATSRHIPAEDGGVASHV